MSRHTVTVTIDEELIEKAIQFYGDESYRLHIADVVLEEVRKGYGRC